MNNLNDEQKENSVSCETIEQNQISLEQIEKLLNDNYSKYDELLSEYFTKKSEVVEVVEVPEVVQEFAISNDAVFLGVAMFAIGLVFIFHSVLKSWVKI
ncbi:MAG: hypothetical protein ACRDD4_13190 [Culicoidibacterales bacterium]